MNFLTYIDEENEFINIMDISCIKPNENGYIIMLKSGKQVVLEDSTKLENSLSFLSQLNLNDIFPEIILYGKTGLNDSQLEELLVIIQASRIRTTSPVTISPNLDLYTLPQNITLATETEGASIYYTTDGSTPDSNSNLYSEPFSITGDPDNDLTIKTIAIKDGFENSEITTKLCTFYGKIDTPYTFPPIDVVIPLPVTITIGTSVSGSIIKYTTNGVDPTMDSDEIIDTGSGYKLQWDSGGIYIFKFMETKDGWENSDIYGGTYNFAVGGPGGGGLPMF